jgi:hypothetical protein
MAEMSFRSERMGQHGNNKNIWSEDSSKIQTFAGTLELRSKGGGCSVYCQGYGVNLRVRQGNLMF